MAFPNPFQHTKFKGLQSVSFENTDFWKGHVHDCYIHRLICKCLQGMGGFEMTSPPPRLFRPLLSVFRSIGDFVRNTAFGAPTLVRRAHSFTRLLDFAVPGASKTDENVIPTKSTMFCGKTRCFRETPHFRLQAVSHTFLQLVIRSQKISKASSQPQNLPSPSPFALATKSASHSPLVFRNSNLKEGGRGPK